MSDVVRLQADLDVAKIRHQAKRSEATAEALEKAQKAYDDAINPQEPEQESPEAQNVESSKNEQYTIPDDQTILDRLTGFTPEELEKFKRHVQDFFSGPTAAATRKNVVFEGGSDLERIQPHVAPPSLVAQLAGISAPANEPATSEPNLSEVNGAGDTSSPDAANDSLGKDDSGAATTEPASESASNPVTPVLSQTPEPAKAAAAPAKPSKKPAQSGQKKTTNPAQ
ncbi:hypothetical protein [Siphonobacter sp. SORGH_AS_0500]|uniref:hypothetical protein n=1 Tax=Siphonobacter sp. SORGH_AS_0500 TaxID=1864824 RepID=UPI002857811F|nr:hypothetical protein [Siphonobacter sp. SORGH_AS_0500]MDR6195912.1 hypothetical protein [Siphonobacter sp. SORGH_AS_0500]